LARLTLDPEQLEAVARMVNEPTRAALNASQYGTGKTVVTVEVGEQIGAKVKLIVCPLFTKYAWEDTIKGQYPNAVVRHVNSRKLGKEALADLLDGVEGWYIIGREYLASKTIKESLMLKSQIIDFMAYDECSRFANYKSMNYKMIKKYKPKYKMALSATPGANKFTGLFAITQWLWPMLEGHRSFWKWVDVWCAVAEEDDYFAGKVITGELNPGAFVSSLPCYVRLEKDFGTPTEITIPIDLSAPERKIYDLFMKNLIVWIKDNPLIVSFPIVKNLRLRQMSLGEVSVIGEGEDQVVFFEETMKSTKYDTLRAIIEEYPDEPMLILTHSAKFARAVTTKLQKDGHRAMEWTGQIPEENRHAIKYLFEENEGIDYIVATPASIGEGVDGLQKRARFMVWLSRDVNNMLNEQAFRRLHRRGQTKQVVSIDIQALDTYDDSQLPKLIQNALDMNQSLKKD